MKRTSLFTIFLIIILSGCNVPSTGQFQLEQTLAHEECFEAVFPFEPQFLAARTRSGSVGLFLQSKGGNFQNVDVLYFEIFEIPAQTPKVYELGSPEVPTAAHGELELSGTCPDLLASFRLEGTLTLDQYSDEIDGIIAGRLDDATVHDLQSGEVVAQGLSGEFSIVVKRGQPYEEFRQ